MANTASTSPYPSSLSPGSLLAIAVVATWLVTVFIAGAAGAFVTPAGQPPVRMAIGFGLPVLTFLGLLAVSRGFRGFVLRLDLPLIAAVQAWRVGGFVFIALYTYDMLPGAFAWPAGLGDIAIGTAAPWIALALVRRKNFLTSKTFAVWNYLGILDLVVAVTIGAIESALATGAVGEITTRPMAQLPLVLIPAFLVPLFIMLHVSALMQASKARQ
jgi:hypothetical protein